MESYEEELLGAIREREPGESVLAAFGRFVRQPRGVIADQDPEAREQLAALTRMITESPSLLARERRIHDDYTASLAALIAEETGADTSDTAPWVAANAIIGVHRALIDYTRSRVVAGARPPGLAREVATQANDALALLERGLGRYAINDSQPGA
jgi:MftR C-terminal domain